VVRNKLEKALKMNIKSLGRRKGRETAI